MNYDEVMKELESISGINAVRDGSTGRVRAIDFVIYELERPTGTSNFVFGRFGVDYKNGLIRLPRDKKDDISGQLPHPTPLAHTTTVLGSLDRGWGLHSVREDLL
jgi:hypothetical protein